jgi:hypothetical protein
MKNLKYLFLLFLFSCNTSDEEMYKLYAEQFEKNNEIIEKENDKIYLDFHDLAHDEFRGFAVYFKKKITRFYTLKQISDSILNQIETLRTEKTQVQFNRIEKHEIEKLKLSFNSFQIAINNALNKQIIAKNRKIYQGEINKINILLETIYWKTNTCLSGKKVSSDEINSILFKLKWVIIFCEKYILTHYQNSIDMGSIRYSGTFRLIGNSISQTINKADEQQIQLYYAFHDTIAFMPNFRVNNKLLSIKNNKGIYKIKTTTVGKHREIGEIELENPFTGYLIHFPFEIKYTVTEK